MAKLILIADCHVRPDTESAEEFRKMLMKISRTSHDVCFLGDILELWFGLARYDNELNRGFLEWCRRESARRRVFFVEGNHEFYVLQSHSDCFTRGDENVLKIGNLLVTHGDIVAPWYSGHRIFRLLTKNILMKIMLLIVPFAPLAARRVKKMMEKRALHRVFLFPFARVHDFAGRVLTKYEGNCLIMGHFHQCRHEFLPEGKAWFTIPDWKKTRRVGLAEADGSALRIIPWRHIS